MLGNRKAHRRTFFIPLVRLGEVLLHAETVLIERAQHMHGLAVLLLGGLFDPGSTGIRLLFHSFTGDLAHAELKLCIGITTIRPAMEFAFIHPLLGVQ